MNKKYLLTKLYSFGDSVVSMTDGSSFLATTDFSLPYIKKRRRKHVDDLRGRVIVFNFTDDKFDCIKTKDVWYITPLAKILDNPSREEI